VGRTSRNCTIGGSVGARVKSAAEGVAVDKDGNIYGAEVGPKAVKKYTKK
jgi:hypothetical protein